MAEKHSITNAIEMHLKENIARYDYFYKNGQNLEEACRLKCDESLLILDKLKKELTHEAFTDINILIMNFYKFDDFIGFFPKRSDMRKNLKKLKDNDYKNLTLSSIGKTYMEVYKLIDKKASSQTNI